MQNHRNQQAQSMAPAIEYLSQMQRICLDTWRRCGDASMRMSQQALDEYHRIHQEMMNVPLNHYHALGERLSDYQQDMMHMLSDAQVELARTLGEGARATAHNTSQLVEQHTNEMERGAQQQAGAMRDQADAWREQSGAQREQHAQGSHEQHAQPGHEQPAAGQREHQAQGQREHQPGREGRGKGGQDSTSTVHQQVRQ